MVPSRLGKHSSDLSVRMVYSYVHTHMYTFQAIAHASQWPSRAKPHTGGYTLMIFFPPRTF